MKDSEGFSFWKKFSDKDSIKNSFEEPREITSDDTLVINQTADSIPLKNEVNTQILKPPAQNSTEEKKPPVDAVVYISLATNKMQADIEVSPPENGGQDVTAAQIISKLQLSRITLGVLDDVINDIVNEKLYDKRLTVAKGIPPADGQDGYVEDCFSRINQIKLDTKEDGSVDFKNLNLINCITKDTVICNITRPTTPVDGKNIAGDVVRARYGKEPEIPMGKNTAVSEDGLTLKSTCGGNLYFLNGKFHVDDVLRVHGNVDNSVGNIDFCGDVLVEGDVLEGFTIKSTKNIKVLGTVEGASVYADGNIVLSKGMNGMNKGILHAGNDIECRFLENCTVKAGRNITADSILNSTVCADDKIVVKGRRGVIIGGSCTALNSIEAKAIGAPSNVPTVITLGATPETFNLQKTLTRDLEELQNEMQAILRDVTYLEACAKRITLTQERIDILNAKKKEKLVNMLKSSNISKQLDAINESMENVVNCRLSCSEIFPSTKVVFGNTFMIIKAIENNKLFYYADGEIKKGSIV